MSSFLLGLIEPRAMRRGGGSFGAVRERDNDVTQRKMVSCVEKVVNLTKLKSSIL